MKSPDNKVMIVIEPHCSNNSVTILILICVWHTKNPQNYIRDLVLISVCHHLELSFQTASSSRSTCYCVGWLVGWLACIHWPGQLIERVVCQEIHYPRRPKVAGPHKPAGAYPVALIPGQFQDHYKSYVLPLTLISRSYPLKHTHISTVTSSIEPINYVLNFSTKYLFVDIKICNSVSNANHYLQD